MHLQVFHSPVISRIHGKFRSVKLIKDLHGKNSRVLHDWFGIVARIWGLALLLLLWPHSVSKDLPSIYFMPGMMVSVLGGKLCSETEIVSPVFNTYCGKL